MKFCKIYNINLVTSHLQHVNIISALAQPFLKINVIHFRHHFKFHLYSNDSGLKRNRNEIIFDKIINRLSKHIVVPSQGVYDGMVRFENINKEKLSIIPYIYNFDNYGKPDFRVVETLRAQYGGTLNLIMVARLIPFKRHNIVFEVINKLVKEGKDIKLLVLDEGPEEAVLKKYIAHNNLNNNIFMLGFRTDFLEFMEISELLIHPSLTDASNSVVKEMGILKKAVAVCEGVGDFSEYIIHNKNGFLLPVTKTQDAIEQLIREIYKDKSDLKLIGENLQNGVLKKFTASESIINQHVELYKNKIK